MSTVSSAYGLRPHTKTSFSSNVTTVTVNSNSPFIEGTSYICGMINSQYNGQSLRFRMKEFHDGNGDTYKCGHQTSTGNWYSTSTFNSSQLRATYSNFSLLGVGNDATEGCCFEMWIISDQQDRDVMCRFNILTGYTNNYVYQTNGCAAFEKTGFTNSFGGQDQWGCLQFFMSYGAITSGVICSYGIGHGG